MSTMTTAERTLPLASPRASRALLWTVLREDRRTGLLATLVLVATVGAGLLIPPALGQIVDIVNDGGNRSELMRPLVVILLATVAQGVLVSLGLYLIVRVGERALATVRERVISHALDLPQSALERGGTGDLISRVSNDVDQVSQALREGIPQLLWSALTIVLTVVGLAALDWRFALAGLLALPFYVWAAHGYTVVAPPLYAAERQAEGARSQSLVETLGAISTIQALLLGPRHLRRIARGSEVARAASIRATDKTVWFWSRMHVGEVVGTGAVLLMGAWMVGHGRVSLGVATAAALYFIRLYDPIGALVYLLDEVQAATASMRRLNGILQVPVDARTSHSAPQGAALQLDDLRFGYPDGPEVLHGINLEVRPGEHLALVGTSGAGKSTIAALVAGVHEPSAGSITLGGADITTLPRQELAAQVTLVTQEVHVFVGTLADDLRLAKADASDDDLHAALTAAGAAQWVALLPDGLATQVGTGGHSLTPVQAQQIALARLVLKDPQVAVLDEATAEAGSSGARELEACMDRVLAGRTALLVAHRLTTAAAADRVIVLERGQVIEEGPPGTLAQGAGPYAQLWQAWRSGRTE